MERAVLDRVHAIESPVEIDDPEYAFGLRAAVCAAIEHWIAAIELGERRAPPVPVALLAQVRVAARRGVSLGTVQCRCVAAYHVLGRHLIDEAERNQELVGRTLSTILASQAAVFERTCATLHEEYEREARTRPQSSRAQLADRVRRLLAGELIDTTDIPYDFGLHHVGVIAEGSDAPQEIHGLAKALDGRPLLVHPDRDVVWAWVGTRRPVDRERLDRALTSSRPAGVPLAMGEPGHGTAGWRLTHQQARDVFPIALREHSRVARYAENALPACIERDDVLTTSLRELYVVPLERMRNGGVDLLATARAYFAAGRNGESAAASLGVTRQTVSNRLKTIEEKLGRSLMSDTADIELALQLAEVDRRRPQ